MLTLDTTTLFYYSLPSRSINPAVGIKNWASNVAKSTKGGKGSKSTTSGSATPTLVGGDKSKSSHSVIAIDVDGFNGGVADADETTGVEQKAAQNSPPKKGKRLTSAVSNC
jgi:hypothetical protein